jgi:hypothetical protein
MSRNLTSLYRSDNSDANQVEVVELGIESRGPGQWDEVSAVWEGHWTNPEAARAAILAKRIRLDGQSGDYAFYPADGTVRTTWAKGGRVRAEVTAPGLFARKLKAVKFSESTSYQLTDINVLVAQPGLSTGTKPRLNFRNWLPGFDVTVAWRPSGTDLLDLATAGRRVTSHWAATAAGIPLSSQTNPFTGGAGSLTWHYPCDWYYEVQPGDSVGAGKLLIATFRFRYQLAYTF